MIDLVTKLDEQTAKRIKLYAHPNNRASEAGHPCERFLVAVRIYQDKQALHDIGLQRIFDEGNLHERAVLRELEEAGFTVVEQQRPFTWPEFQLSGRIDGRIKVNGHLPPIDVKSCSPNSFRAIKSMAPEDIVKSKYSWIRKYPAQILCYNFMANEEEGALIFKNKVTGEKIQKDFPLSGEHLVYTETILQRLTRVNDYVERGELPPAEPIDDCKGCAFAHTLCFPDQDYGPGYEIMMADGELLAKLERREALVELAKEFRDIDEELKEFFKGRNAVVGGFIIESKEVERRAYTVQAGNYWRVDIKRF